MTPHDVIAAGYRMAKALLHRYVDDLAPAEFHHQPVPGANSAAWVVGHLAATLRRTAERLGVTGLPELPADVAAKLATTKKAAEDQSGLGDPAVLLKVFDAAAAAVIAAIAKVPTETLAGPSPAPVPFSTNFGEGLAFGALHLTLHAGQLTVIRRGLGKPPLV